jgi:hypothetical protein
MYVEHLKDGYEVGTGISLNREKQENEVEEDVHI